MDGSTATLNPSKWLLALSHVACRTALPASRRSCQATGSQGSACRGSRGAMRLSAWPRHLWCRGASGHRAQHGECDSHGERSLRHSQLALLGIFHQNLESSLRIRPHFSATRQGRDQKTGARLQGKYKGSSAQRALLLSRWVRHGAHYRQSAQKPMALSKFEQDVLPKALAAFLPQKPSASCTFSNCFLARQAS